MIVLYMHAYKYYYFEVSILQINKIWFLRQQQLAINTLIMYTLSQLLISNIHYIISYMASILQFPLCQSHPYQSSLQLS